MFEMPQSEPFDFSAAHEAAEVVRQFRDFGDPVVSERVCDAAHSKLLGELLNVRSTAGEQLISPEVIRALRQTN